MAIFKCNECNQGISDTATTCPKCGAPVTAESIALAAKKLLPKKWSKAEIIFGSIFCLFGIFLTYGHIAHPSSDSTSSRYPSNQQDQILMCAKRGVAYFADIGSFPKLSNGQSAVDVALIRCTNTTTAF